MSRKERNRIEKEIKGQITKVILEECEMSTFNIIKVIINHNVIINLQSLLDIDELKDLIEQVKIEMIQDTVFR